MCTAVRFSRFEFADEALENSGLKLSGDEVRVAFNDKITFLPVVYSGSNQLFVWGNKDKSKKLPRTGFCRFESLESGKWQWLNPVNVKILAATALVNGVWFQVREGIDGVIVEYSGLKACYILTKPSTHYFKIMTGSDRMPVLINQII